MNKIKKIIKQITDNDLNTIPGLTTANYLFELIGLKDKVDLRKFSRNFIEIDKLIKNIDNEKEPKFDKNHAFNKDFGVNQNEVLEGHRMAQIQGVEKCGGDVQTPGVKKVGYSYWCTANKDFYVCKVENSLNYIDSAYFDAFSNYSLLGKLQNLAYIETIRAIPIVSIGNLDIRAYIFNNMVFISSYLDTGSLSINGITNNGLDIAKLEFNKKFVGVMSPIINNTNGFQGNVRLLSDGRILLESNIPNVPPLTRMGFVIVTSIFI